MSDLPIGILCIVFHSKKQRTSEKKALIRAGQEAEKVKQHIEVCNI